MAHFFWQFHSHKMKICLGGAWIIKVIRGLLILYSFPLSVLPSRFYISSAQRAAWSGSGRFSFAVTPPVRLSRSQQSQWANSTWALSVKALHNTLYNCSLMTACSMLTSVECQSIGGPVKITSLDKINLTPNCICAKLYKCLTAMAACEAAFTLQQGPKELQLWTVMVVCQAAAVAVFSMTSRIVQNL